ncbi:MAG TPA: hypothetical protein VFQ35_21250 [Polyangiaceae bacterium]|nr:hypothetical protein [Polyangiaceae bacterium]
MTALKLGVRTALPLESARGLVQTLCAVVLGCALTAWLERVASPSHAVDRALVRDAFGLWLPLAAYAAAERIGKKGRLELVIAALPRYGLSRRASLAGAVLALGGVLAIVGACCGAISVVVAHEDGSSALLSDLVASTWIGALGGVSYAVWLGFASGFGRRGRRGTFLILDLIFGSSSRFWALPFPRAHLRNLLGGTPLVGLSQAASVGLLAVLIGVVFALTLARVPD